MRLKVIAALLSLSGAIAAEAQTFEKTPALSAKAILRPELLKSDAHTVKEAVRNDGYMNYYDIDSIFGSETVTGTMLLEKRVNEILAAKSLKERSSTAVAASAGKDVAVDIVTAPVNAVKKVAETVSDSEKLKDTIASVPGGVYNLFKSAAQVIGAGAQAVYNSGKSAVGSETAQGQGAGEFFSNAALDYSGYNKSFRNLAKELKVDPYTKNEVLRSELKRVASIQSSVRFTKKFVPGLPSVPGVSQANSYLGLAENAAAYDDPDKVRELNEKVIAALSTDKDKNQAFQKNVFYTPFLKAGFTKSLERLKDVKNAAALIEMAARAESESGALYYISAARMLADYNDKHPLDQITGGVRIPAAVTKAGHIYIPVPVDHLVWTKEVQTIFTDFKARVSKEHKVKDCEAVITGTVSVRAKKELRARGVSKIVEKASA